jgi:hypothetical protein
MKQRKDRMEWWNVGTVGMTSKSDLIGIIEETHIKAGLDPRINQVDVKFPA